MKFPCTRCGKCCRMLEHVPALHDFDRGDGVCVYLSGNLCSIYEHRPLICNSTLMYEEFFRDRMSEEEFIAVNVEACKKISELVQ